MFPGWAQKLRHTHHDKREAEGDLTLDRREQASMTKETEADVAVNQGILLTTSSWQRQVTDSPGEPLEGGQAFCNADSGPGKLMLGSLASRNVRGYNILWVSVTRFAVLCYNSQRRQIQ